MQQIPTMVLNQLVKGLETTQQQLQKNAVEMAELRAEVKGLTKEVEKVNKILRDDGSATSLTSRVALIENSIADNTTDIITLKKTAQDFPSMAAWIRDQKAANKTTIEGKWKVYAAAIPGIIALIAAAITAAH